MVLKYVYGGVALLELLPLSLQIYIQYEIYWHETTNSARSSASHFTHITLVVLR